jgi:hypothetical protein
MNGAENARHVPTLRLAALILLAGLVTSAAMVIPSRTARAASGSFVRGSYGQDSSTSGFDVIKGTGFNAVTAMPSKAKLDALAAAGMKGLVWLWGWDNTTCSFAKSDAEIRTYVSAVAGHPAILAYQIDDEPNARLCPTAPSQIRARSDLVHSIDPSKPTYVVVSTWNGAKTYPYEDFAGTTDIMGLDVYPCSRSYGCRFDNINNAIANADADGVQRYWAILQDFEDTYYRLPTTDELRQQFDLWDASRMEGYFVYHWNYGNLESHPDHLSLLAGQNARDFGGSVTTSPSPSPSPTSTQTTYAAPADTTAPLAPTGLLASWVKRTSSLTWRAATDNVAVVSYRVYRDGALIGSTSSLSYSDRPSFKVAHLYQVRAVDAAGNVSQAASVQLAVL